MDNAIMILSFSAIGCMAIVGILHFCKLPAEKKIDNLKEYLKWAVTESEKLLGSNTGQLKLRYCYALCCNTFKWLPSLLSFAEFSLMVDEALQWMRKQIVSNGALEMYVKGEDE